MESRIDRHVESGRVPDTGATWPIKTMPFLHSSSQVDDKSRRAFDVSRSAIGRRMINRDRIRFAFERILSRVFSLVWLNFRREKCSMDLDIVQWIIKLGGNFIEYPYRVKISRNLEFSRKLQMYLSGVD